MNFNINDCKVINSLCKDGYAHDIMTGKKYEADSCPEVWEQVHKVMHRKTKLQDVFGDFHNILEENNRILALALNEDNKLARYAIGGDTDFNMEFKNELEINIYCNNKNINEDVKNKIIEIYQHKYCLENFSLMLSTGGTGSLQSYKGRENGKCKKFEKSDNVCMFIYNLKKDFYDNERNENNVMFNSVNLGYEDKEENKLANNKGKAIICSYLNMFNNIYDYCEQIYKIDKELVDDILEFAKTEYKNDYNKGITEFLEIIKRMWKCKRDFLTKNV